MDSLKTTLPSQPPPLFDATDPSLAETLSHDVKGNVGWVASMGATGILYLPGAFYEATKNFIKAIQNFDAEATVVSGLRICNIPFGLAYAVQRITIFFILLLKGLVILSLSVASYVAGGFFVLIELTLESYRLYHLIRFKNELNSVTLNSPYHKLSYIHTKYFLNKNLDELKGQLDSLARKIRPWLVQELQKELPMLLQGLKKNDARAIEKATELLETIEIQTNKAKRMYIVGIIALSIAAIIFGISLVIAPHFAVLLIVAGLIGTTMEFGRWFAPESYLDQKDHKWRWDPWLPDCLKSKKENTPPTEGSMIELCKA